ncbi:DUF4402 domain-containing protein [Pontibacter silvestris]|uniref:DUF4402 domain-containing protein n=1 Tax=Pontibacter silvestris TaxID=2305183 RepID=A0ABW4X2U2_9BACT|nr:DUF4402 domain-containing protein [Pontibacter silvestris]MCC9135776.1 DUF4402 domain-containing protein [Pontibacter silvestris]
MKTTYQITLFFAAILAFTSTASAQDSSGASAKAKAFATIVEPISIQKETDMNFGSVILEGSNGKVVLNPEGTPSPEGVSLASAGQAPAVATFKVAGLPNYSYSITLPASHTITNMREGGGDMTIDNFVTIPSEVNQGAGKLDDSGTQILKVGATLNINANQEPGEYTNSAGFEVKVNYN